MAYLGSWKIDDYINIPATTTKFSTGALYDATAITYRIYEDETNTEIVSDQNMTKFDSETGFYLNRVQATTASGFEKGKCYTVLIKATVDSVAGAITHTFQIEAEVDANIVSDKTDFALTSAYDPAKAASSQTSVDTIDTVVDAIKAKTDNLPASPAAVGSNMGTVSSVTGNVDGSVGSVVTKTGYELVAAYDNAKDDVLAVLGTPTSTTISADIANVDANVAAGIPSYETFNTATMVHGVERVGTVSTIAAHDGVYLEIGEHATQGIEEILDITTSSTTSIPNILEIYGRYDANSPTHFVYVYPWNYVTGAWETNTAHIITMTGRSTDFGYSVPLTVSHQDPSTGAMKFRFLHNTIAYITNHYLALDSVRVSKIATTNSMAQQVSTILTYVTDIDLEVDDLVTTSVPAIQSSVAALPQDKLGYALTNAYDAAKNASSQTTQDTIDTIVDAIKVVTDKLNTMLQASGANYQYTVDAIENAPSGSTSVDLTPVTDAIAVVDGVVDAIKLKTDNLPANPAAVGSNMGTVTTVGTVTDKTGFSLVSDYDAAKSAASQTSVNTIDTVVDAIKLKTDNLPASPAAVGSNMGTVSSVTNPVTVGTNNDKTGYSGVVSDKTGFALTSAYDAAKNASSQTSVDAIKTVVDGVDTVTDGIDTVVDAIKVQTDKLNFTGTYVDSISKDIATSTLAKFVTVDTTEETASVGSVAALSQSTITGSGIGPGYGSAEYEHTELDSNSNPIANVQMWLYTDVAMTNCVGYGVTDVFGQFTFWQNVGTYYMRKYHVDYTYTNPYTITVVAQIPD